MSNKKIVIIAGNGLNRIIANVAANQRPSKYSLHNSPINPHLVSQSIHELCDLWNQFDCFEAIKRFQPDLSIEKILGLFYQFKDVIKNDESRRGELSGINSALNDYLGNLIFNNIKAVTQKFIEHERLSCYKDIKKLFPHFGADFKFTLRDNGVDKIFICSTNYDGIFDTVLNDNGNFFRDGFCNSRTNPKYLGIWKKILENEDKILVHLHGTYKMTKVGSETFKIVGNHPNENPVIVLDQPDSKEDRILNDSVLKVYFEKLIRELQTCDRLIILGNSFQNEPHLKKVIKENFNRMNTELVICDLFPEEVERQLRDSYVGPIHNFTTDRLDSETQFLNLFDQLFSDNLMYCNRNVINFYKAA